MQRPALLGWLGLVYLYCILVIIGLPGLFGDYLFYHSDIFSLSVFTLAAAFVIFPAVGAVAYAISRAPRKISRLAGEWAPLVAITGIVDIFLGYLLLFLVVWLNWDWLNHIIIHPVIALAVCVLPAAILVLKHTDKSGLIERTKHIGIFSLIGAPLLIGYSVFSAQARLQEPVREKPSQHHLVLIVLDGWPSQFLHAYNPDAQLTPFDDALAEGRVYLGAHTSAAWTAGYFGTLYNGNTRIIGGDKRYNPVDESLGARLQADKIRVRFFNYHRNGIPDSSAAHRSDHEGLRSYFLSERYDWIPQSLGLEYHVALSGKSISKNFGWFLPRWVYGLANPTSARADKNLLVEVLIPHLRRNRNEHTSSFTLFHTGWKSLGNSSDVSVSKLPDAQKITQDEDTDFPVEKIRRDNYRYHPSLEPLVRIERSKIATQALRLGYGLGQFLKTLKADPELADTVVILTADHGRIYAKGRLWYGYHPNREVVRIPLFVFDSEPGGESRQMLATPGLTGAINRFFTRANTSRRFEPAEESKGPAYSMTLRADVQKEWFLIASYPGKSYWINLHPKGTGQSRELTHQDYVQTEVARFDGPPPELAPELGTILKSFGLEEEMVHSAFRSNRNSDGAPN